MRGFIYGFILILIGLWAGSAYGAGEVILGSVLANVVSICK